MIYVDLDDLMHVAGRTLGELLHSLTRNRPLVDGNNRLALAGALAFYGVNGIRLTLSNDEAYDLVMAVASGLDDVEPIAERLRSARPRGVDTAGLDAPAARPPRPHGS